MNQIDIDALSKNMVNAPRNFLCLPAGWRDKEYHLSPEAINPNGSSSHDIIVRHVKPQSRVLDVGCSYGYIGEYLAAKKQCEVYGLEINPSARAHISSRGFFKGVEGMDLDRLSENVEALLALGYSNFDCIICADVLEHLLNVNEALVGLTRLLAPQGKILVSIPNINHVDIVYNLLRGRFNYSPFGLLDNTHLKFFTRQSFMEWIRLLSSEHHLSLTVELLQRTYHKNITEPDEVFQKNRKKRMLKKILKLYKLAGIEEEAYVLQNIFKIEFAPAIAGG